jgi:hypothetical protein
MSHRIAHPLANSLGEVRAVVEWDDPSVVNKRAMQHQIMKPDDDACHWQIQKPVHEGACFPLGTTTQITSSQYDSRPKENLKIVRMPAQPSLRSLKRAVSAAAAHDRTTADGCKRRLGGARTALRHSSVVHPHDLGHLTGDTLGQHRSAVVECDPQCPNDQNGGVLQRPSRVGINVNRLIDHEMQILTAKSAELSEGRKDLGLDLLKAAKNTHALFLAKLVEVSTKNQPLQFQILPAGKMNCHDHSVHAFGYLRSTGKHYSAVPRCEIRIMDPTDSLDVLFERLSHCIGQQHSKDLRLLASWLKPDTRADP